LQGAYTVRQAGPLVPVLRTYDAAEARLRVAIELPSSVRTDRSNVFDNLIDCRSVPLMESERRSIQSGSLNI
jgi:hypothetical protein